METAWNMADGGHSLPRYKIFFFYPGFWRARFGGPGLSGLRGAGTRTGVREGGKAARNRENSLFFSRFAWQIFKHDRKIIFARQKWAWAVVCGLFRWQNWENFQSVLVGHGYFVE